MYPLPAQNANRPVQSPYPDPNNSIVRPSGPQYALCLSEGNYTLRDQIQLGTPPPLGSQITTTNPLDTRTRPPTAGTSLSLSPLAPPRELKKYQSSFSAINGKPGTPNEIESNSKTKEPSGGEHKSHHFAGISSPNFRALAFGSGASHGSNVSPTKETKDSLKKRKPKQSIHKTSGSSLISAASTHASLSKRLHERRFDGFFAFVNVDRVFQWLDFTSAEQKVQHMTRIFFSGAHPLCHDANSFSRTTNHVDVIIGFSTSDIMWYEPISQRYSRINKRGIINATAISRIRWIPGSENLFIAAHLDGSLVVYDKEKEDTPLTVDDIPNSGQHGFEPGNRKMALQVLKSSHAKNQKTNPVAFYKVTNYRINDFELSPDGRFAAVVSEDESLRILDLLREQLIDVYSSYYGGMACVCWSPDGKYIVTGSQDDLVSIWSFEDRMLVARGLGHRSWVTSVAFDPWRCDENNYRFGSVAEDRRILLWDFSVGMLHRPRAASVRQSISSHPASDLAYQGAGSQDSTGTGEKRSQESNESQDSVSHDVEPRANVPMLPSVYAKRIEESNHGLTWIGFEEDCVITACRAGHIQTWDRPATQKETLEVSHAPFSDPFRS